MRMIKEFIAKAISSRDGSHESVEKAVDRLTHLNNSSVAVIGNAQSLLSRKHGARIDEHDYVIRMNAGCPTMPEAQGERTDILALSMPLTGREVEAMFGAPKIIWMSPKRKRITPELRDAITCYYPESYWKLLHDELRQARPSTGAMVINLLTGYLHPAKLSLFGFDFKKSKTFYLEKDHAGPHDYDLEEIYVTNAVERSRGTIFN